MNISIRQGETLELTVSIDDLTAQTVRFIAEDDNAIIIDETENFSTSGTKELLPLKQTTLIALGEYEYMLVCYLFRWCYRKTTRCYRLY